MPVENPKQARDQIPLNQIFDKADERSSPPFESVIQHHSNSSAIDSKSSSTPAATVNTGKGMILMPNFFV
jgi:hypothetical protein